MTFANGAVAQLGERSNRTAEVVGSIPSGSTKLPKKISKILRRPLGRRGPVAQKSALSQQDRQSQRLLYARATAALMRSVIEIVLQRAAVCSVRSALRPARSQRRWWRGCAVMLGVGQRSTASGPGS